MNPDRSKVGGGLRLPKGFYERPLTPKNRTRNERRERIKDAFMMVGISAFLVLIFLAGMNAMLAFEAAAW